VGARNMQNFALLKVLGRCRRPVLLKRGMSSTSKSFLNVGRIHCGRTQRERDSVERGIRTYETATRNTCDIAAVPVPRMDPPARHRGSEPRHRQRSLVPAISRAAVAVAPMA